jgi:succinate-semialdehyde dehydrogenase/glutarate-semialdehyde dehydrogenase
MKQMVVGNGMDAKSTLGPLIDKAALDKVSALVDDAKSLGGKIQMGGRPHAMGHNFYEPTLILDATSKMRLSREEIFGPVAALYPFDSEDEALQMANDTVYGLASYCYTSDLGRAFRMAERLQYGVVGMNEGIISTEVAPFGGVKESGFGREGSFYGIEDYITTKYVLMGGI